ncbi:hypothetical protein NPIL_470151 [Nephila pilipes]|uniref:Uncharacterized protein n=1 Tax=Nephila pilipes TaxID=299642 RepID=A0A8X6THW2_NEPPI|nr:hypothetical protein NPIL_470151 [Nephila pilipes]
MGKYIFPRNKSICKDHASISTNLWSSNDFWIPYFSVNFLSDTLCFFEYTFQSGLEFYLPCSLTPLCGSQDCSPATGWIEEIAKTQTIRLPLIVWFFTFPRGNPLANNNVPYHPSDTLLSNKVRIGQHSSLCRDRYIRLHSIFYLSFAIHGGGEGRKGTDTFLPGIQRPSDSVPREEFRELAVVIRKRPWCSFP